MARGAVPQSRAARSGVTIGTTAAHSVHQRSIDLPAGPITDRLLVSTRTMVLFPTLIRTFRPIRGLARIKFPELTDGNPTPKHISLGDGVDAAPEAAKESLIRRQNLPKFRKWPQ